MPAPIVLFTYNRPYLTYETLRALQSNLLANKTSLFVYSDGPKHESDVRKVEAVRKIIREQKWCASLEIIERDENLGLASSITRGVSEVMNLHGRAIVLEDDIFTSPHFLNYMNDALTLYENDHKVWSIGGCNFFSNNPQTPETFFIPIPDTWGWATWADRWEKFEPDSSKLRRQLKEKGLEGDFNLNGSYDFMQLLQLETEGKVSSWAIRWQAQAYLKNAVSLYPKHAVSTHMESSNGTHNKSLTIDLNLASEPITCIYQNAQVKEQTMSDLRKGYQSTLYPPKIKYADRLKEKILEYVPFSIKNRLGLIERQVEWVGDYDSWESASREATGYDLPEIQKKVRSSTLQLKFGEVMHEQDSVTFPEPTYNWPLVAQCLMQANKNGMIDVLDFGGALGSTYFEHKPLFSKFKVNWSIVEQPKFVECGKNEFEDESLKFYHSNEEVFTERQPSILLISGTLQYIPDYRNLLEQVDILGIKIVIVDRIPLLNRSESKIVVQKVHEPIYNASYPCILFGTKDLDELLPSYALVSSFSTNLDHPIMLRNGDFITWKGHIYEKTK